MKAKRAMSLDPDVVEILKDMSSGQASASAYIESLVRDAERAWRTALNVLRDAGWQSADLRAACDALNGYGLAWDLGRPATFAAVELLDAQRLNQVCEKHDADPARWYALAHGIRENEILARCLLELVFEFWRFNPRVDRALGIGGGE